MGTKNPLNEMAELCMKMFCATKRTNQAILDFQTTLDKLVKSNQKAPLKKLRDALLASRPKKS